MAWTKYFKTVNTAGGMSPLGNGSSRPDIGYRNYQNQLPEVYVGHPNRVERYNQYEQMDLDSEVNGALDILAEFSTQSNLADNLAFSVKYKDRPTDSEVKIIREELRKWSALNKFEERIFKMFRNAIKYGDQIFLRDPETFELFWVEMAKVIKVIVNESSGKEPEQYVIRDVAPNFMNLSATALPASDSYYSTTSNSGGGSFARPNSPNSAGGRFMHQHNEMVINAEHIVHLSLGEGLDANWPFGTSVLENIYKVFKQKELLEDAIIIYRVQRAPERRVFYIDTGNMPSHMAMAFVERVKNEVHQRRIPTQNGGGATMMDATYSPMSINEDYFFPQTADGRGSKVETLPGGTGLGEIDDLRYFTNKLFRGLRIPSSYLPTGSEDGSQSVTDGKVGTALIQEWRFNQYCKRLQSNLSSGLDSEFKMYLRWRGFNIDTAIFTIVFNEPQNFAQYKQAELDASKINGFTSLEAVPYLSKRFLLQRYLGLTEEEMQQNDEMWAEENGGEQPDAAVDGLRNLGITPGAIQGDMDMMGDAALGAMGGELPAQPPAGTTPAPGAMPPGGTAAPEA
jgi:hypothetical protein